MSPKSSPIARIVARYDADWVRVNRSSGQVVRIEPVDYYTQYDFWPSLDGGIYGTGLGQLLGPINEAVNTNLNSAAKGEITVDQAVANIATAVEEAKAQ